MAAEVRVRATAPLQWHQSRPPRWRNDNSEDVKNDYNNHQHGMIDAATISAWRITWTRLIVMVAGAGSMSLGTAAVASAPGSGGTFAAESAQAQQLLLLKVDRRRRRLIDKRPVVILMPQIEVPQQQQEQEQLQHFQHPRFEMLVRQQSQTQQGGQQQQQHPSNHQGRREEEGSSLLYNANNQHRGRWQQQQHQPQQYDNDNSNNNNNSFVVSPMRGEDSSQHEKQQQRQAGDGPQWLIDASHGPLLRSYMQALGASLFLFLCYLILPRRIRYRGTCRRTSCRSSYSPSCCCCFGKRSLHRNRPGEAEPASGSGAPTQSSRTRLRDSRPRALYLQTPPPSRPRHDPGAPTTRQHHRRPPLQPPMAESEAFGQPQQRAASAAVSLQQATLDESSVTDSLLQSLVMPFTTAENAAKYHSSNPRNSSEEDSTALSWSNLSSNVTNPKLGSLRASNAIFSSDEQDPDESTLSLGPTHHKYQVAEQHQQQPQKQPQDHSHVRDLILGSFMLPSSLEAAPRTPLLPSSETNASASNSPLSSSQQRWTSLTLNSSATSTSFHMARIPDAQIQTETMRRLLGRGIRLVAHGVHTAEPKRIWIRLVTEQDDQQQQDPLRRTARAKTSGVAVWEQRVLTGLVWQTEVPRQVQDSVGNARLVFVRGAVHAVDLIHIVYCDVGKKTLAFLKPTNQPIPDVHCFSLLTRQGSLDLQAHSRLERDVLVTCLNGILQQVHHRPPQPQQMSATAGTANTNDTSPIFSDLPITPDSLHHQHQPLLSPSPNGGGGDDWRHLLLESSLSPPVPASVLQSRRLVSASSGTVVRGTPHRHTPHVRDSEMEI